MWAKHNRDMRVLDIPTAADPHTFIVEHDDVHDVTNNLEQTQLETQNVRVLYTPTTVVQHHFTVVHDDVHDVSNIQAPTENSSSPSLVQMFVKTHNTQAQQQAVTDVNMPTVQ